MDSPTNEMKASSIELKRPTGCIFDPVFSQHLSLYENQEVFPSVSLPYLYKIGLVKKHCLDSAQSPFSFQQSSIYTHLRMIYSFALFSFKAPPVDPGTLPCLCSVASDDSMLPVLSPFYFYDVGFDLVALFYKELPSLMESFVGVTTAMSSRYFHLRSVK